MSKYRNIKKQADGYTFDSLAEFARYQELKLLERAGEIKDIQVHPRFILDEPFEANGVRFRAMTYAPDFVYTRLNDGVQVAEDVKGFRTQEYKIKMRLFVRRYPKTEFIEIKV